jgi:hypothetical protein
MDGAWGYKAEPCRMLGYDTNCNDAYMILVIRSGKVITRGNCVFDISEIHRSISEELSNEYNENSNIEADDNENNDNNNIDVFELQCEMDNDNSTESSIDEQYDEEEYPYWGPTALLTMTMIDKWYYDVCCLTQPATVLPPNPRSVKEALSGPDAAIWKEAIDKEMQLFKQHNTWEISDNQKGRAMKTKLILKYAFKPDYTIKAKARLVVCGYSQIKNVDYFETYAPTTNTKIVFTMLSIAMCHNYKIATFDVSAAFLEGINDIILYNMLGYLQN